MVLVHTTIEIAASPEKVREVFLNFDKFSEWSPGPMHGVQTIPPSKNPRDVQKNDLVTADFGAMKSNVTVLRNNEQQWRWLGALPLNLFNGDHTFEFNASTTTSGGTTFVNQEDFTGFFGWMTSIGGQTKLNFDKFNDAFKNRVESLS